MEKENLISKLNIKDYSKELENILNNKSYTKTAKNLLLNMFYKIENSYEDFKKVKVEVPNKKEFLEELLQIIYRDCSYIEIIKPTLENDDITTTTEHNECKVINEEKKVITYQNEINILEGLYKLNSKKFEIDSEDETIKRALSNLLNSGEIINKIDSIKDFDGWSWNSLEGNINYDISRLLYYGMTICFGYNDLECNRINTIENIENILKQKYKVQIAEQFIRAVTKIAIIEYVKNNLDARDKLIEKKKNIQISFEKMNDKITYIDEISKQKQKLIKQFEGIKKFLNNDYLLKKEYISKNNYLPQDKRFFSLSDFSESLEKEEKKLEKQIEVLTEKLKPKNYLKEKNKLEKEFCFYNEIDFESLAEESSLDEFIESLIEIINEQINDISAKKDLINKLYIIRFLNIFKLDITTTLGEKYNRQFEKLMKKIITVGCNMKMLAILSKDVEENFRIYKSIFETRIIDFESIYIKITKDNTVKIYDDNTLEKEKSYSSFDNLNIKYNKKIKIF